MSSRESGYLEVNGGRLYHEVRGNGPSVLINTKDALDAEHYREVSEALADEFTVVTWDRPGYSRSAAPGGPPSATFQQQADDTASLIEILGLAPVAVYGSSGGAIVALDLALRCPSLVRGAILHEPPIFAVLPECDEIQAGLAAIVEEGIARGGPRTAMEMFASTMFGPDNWDRYEQGRRERILANAEAFFTRMPQAGRYVVDAAALAMTTTPVVPVLGQENRDNFWGAIAVWIAERTRTDIVEIPGSHAGDVTDVETFVEILRPILRKLS